MKAKPRQNTNDNIVKNQNAFMMLKTKAARAITASAYKIIFAINLRYEVFVVGIKVVLES